jgi:ribosomal protein S15P/S13E
MMNPLPTTPAAPEPEWAGFLAIDWSDQKHCWKLLVAESQQTETGELVHTPEAVQAWAAEWHRRFAGRPLAVCVEQKRGALVYMLSKFPHLVLFPVHPTTSAHFRQAFYPSGCKSDPVDTDLLLSILVYHRQHLRRLDPDTPATRLLQILVEQRRKLVDDRTRYSNQLTAWVKMYFPQVLDWIDDIDSAMGCDLLERWPSLEQLQQVKPNHLHAFFIEHNSRSEERIQQRIQAIYQATRAVADPALLQGGPAVVTGLVAVLKTLNAQIAELDRLIQQAEIDHPDAGLYAALPGAGPALRPRLIVAFGTQRERYSIANQIQSYSGIAPARAQSGGSETAHFRRACPKFLRQTFHEFAAHSITKSPWARAYYDQQKQKGKGHHAAVRALAFKWIRILFRCWKNRTPYDEKTYLDALEKHHSPVFTSVRWQTVAGFKKISLENS